MNRKAYGQIGGGQDEDPDSSKLLEIDPQDVQASIY